MTPEQEKEIWFESQSQAMVKTYQRKILFAQHYYSTYKKEKASSKTAKEKDLDKLARDCRIHKGTLKSIGMQQKAIQRKKEAKLAALQLA